METAETLIFQRREWVVERIGWTVMAAALVAAMAGLFGDGPLSRISVSTEDGAARLSYSRFARVRAPDTLQVGFSHAGAGDQVRLSLPARYVIDDVEVERVTPEPVAVEIGGEQVTYVFRAVEPGGVVTFDVQARHAGCLSATLRVDSRQPLAFEQFVYP